jgi:hypothetical protein
MPNHLINTNNLSDISAAVTARSNLGVGPVSPFTVPQALAWYPNPFATAQRTLILTQAIMYVHLFNSGPTAITIDKLDANVTVVGSAGAVTRMGLYTVTDQVNPFKWASGTAYASLLVDAGTVATDSGTGQKVITLGTPQVIAANTWFGVAGVEQATPATGATRTVGGNSGSTYYTPWGCVSQSYAGGVTLGLSVGGVTGALPATFTPNSAQNTDGGVGIHRSV